MFLFRKARFKCLWEILVDKRLQHAIYESIPQPQEWTQWNIIRKEEFPGSYTCFLCTSGNWQVALVKLTCHPRLRPLFKSLDKWQLVKSTCQVNFKGNPLKSTCASCLALALWRQSIQKRKFLEFFAMFSTTRGQTEMTCTPLAESLSWEWCICDVLHKERPDFDHEGNCQGD